MSVGDGWGARPVASGAGATGPGIGLEPDFLRQARALRERRARVLWSVGAHRLRGFGKPIGLAWLMNVTLALLASLTIYEALDKMLSRSRWAALAARRFDLDWFFDFRAAADDVFASVTAPVVAVGVIALLFTVFLSGGVLGRLRAGERITTAGFLGDCARHFGRFLILFLASSALSGLIVWLFVAKRPTALNAWITYQPSDFVAIGTELLLIGVAAWLVAWMHMAQDLGRLALVTGSRRSPLIEFVRGIGIAARHFDTLAGLYLWTLLGWLVLSFVYLVLSRLAHAAPGFWGTIVLLALAQLYMLGRIWMGFGLTAGLLTWYERKFPSDAPR